MRIRIRTDTQKIQGTALTANGIRIEDAETGELIEDVFRATVHMEAGGLVDAELRVWLADLDVEAEADVVTVCPYCRRAIDTARGGPNPGEGTAKAGGGSNLPACV